MFANLEYRRAVPHAKSIRDAVKLYHSFRNYERMAKQFGVVAFELEAMANENPDEIVSRCGATASVAICIPRMVVVAEQMAANGSISNKYITHRHEQSVQNPVQP